MATALLLLAPLVGLSPGGTAAAAESPEPIPAFRETDPVTHSGDALDDPAIWVDPSQPSRSLVLGNDKLGALESYDLSGRLVQRVNENNAFWGNVDVRQSVTVAGVTRDLVAVARGNGFRLLAVDAGTRLMSSVTDGASVGAFGEGLCMFDDRASGRLYVFTITIAGRLRQFQIVDTDGDTLLEAQLVRDLTVGSESEGCAVDDETGALYVGEQDVALWRYDAAPSGGTARVAVDTAVSDGGHLAPHVEGITVVPGADGSGYVLASAQNSLSADSYVTVYERGGDNQFVKSFRVTDGAEADDCDHTDGIAAVATDLGPDFPAGIFVCQDNNNDPPGSSGNQNFKYVPLQRILTVDPPVNERPVAEFTASCTGLTCSFDATASRDPDGSITAYRWDFGDQTTDQGATVQHTYTTPGDHQVTLTVTDDDDATATHTTTVTTTDTAPAEISFVGMTTVNRNALDWATTVPTATRPQDGLLLFFSRSYSTNETLTGPGTGWTQLDTVVDGTTATTVWQRVATTSDLGSAVRISVPSGYRKAALTMAAYRGTTTTVPFATGRGIPQPGDTSQHTTPVVQNTTPNAWRVSYWSDKSETVTAWTAPTTETVRSTTTGTGGGRISSLLTDPAQPTTTGPQGGLTATTNATTNKATMWTLLLTPAAQTPPPPQNQPPVAQFTTSCTTGGSNLIDQVAWPFYLAHRGGAGTHPENTMTAMRHYSGLYPMQTLGIELDVHRLATGELAVWHAATVDTTLTNTTGTLAQMTADEWRDVRVDWPAGFTGPPPVPAAFWSDVVAEFAHDGPTPRVLVVEVKSDAAVQPLIDSVLANGLRDQVVVQSFYPDRVRRAVDAGLHGMVLHLSDRIDFPSLVADGIDYVGVEESALSAQLVADAHQHGLRTMTWLPNTVTERDTYLPMGVDGLITNFPDRLISTTGPTEPTGSACSFDASDSTDPDGSVIQYSWDFGDGGTATGVRTQHRYEAWGSYDVTLTVTDDRGSTGNRTTTLVLSEDTVP